MKLFVWSTLSHMSYKHEINVLDQITQQCVGYASFCGAEIDALPKGMYACM